MPSLNYTHLSKKPSLFKSFTEVEVVEFDVIYREITSKYEEYERRRLSKRRRKRDIDAGRKFKLELKDKFLMLLVYYRLYITYMLSSFGVEDIYCVLRDVYLLTISKSM